MTVTLELKRAATQAVKSLGLQADLKARAVVLAAADSTVGNSLRDLIQLNEDDPALKALVEEFLRGEGTDKTGQYVRQLLEPAFTAVPAAADIPALFQSALHIAGTLPFPVPDAFYESQRLQDRDMESYLAPVSKSGASMFSSAIHSVLCKPFPAGTEMM
ncbi:hypothetical protein ABBQ32_002608 [Trebouxia sp. C0010 RCD-2024]